MTSVDIPIIRKKKIKKLSDLAGITTLEFPTGESVILNKILEEKDITEVCEMWGEAHSKEIRRIETDAKLKVLTFLKARGYKPLRHEKVRLT